MAMTTYFYYEKMHRTLCTAIISYLLKLKYLKKQWVHFSQVQQGPGMDVLKSSNFYDLIASMRTVSSENFSFIAQFSLFL